MFYFRLVNMLDITKVDEESLWKIVKKTRNSFLLEHPDPYCQGSNTGYSTLSYKDMQVMINNLERELGLNATSTLNENAPMKTLQISGEMFTYLNSCPSSFKKILSFTKYLIENETPSQIMLALTSLIKTSKNAAKDRAVEIFTKAMETFHLLQYEEIQIITKGKCYNKATFDTCSKNNNTTNKEKLDFLGCYYWSNTMYLYIHLISRI